MAGKREIKQWITVNGVHVPIFKGESKADSVKRVTEHGSGKEVDSVKQKKKAEAIKEAYEKQQSFKGTTYEVMEKDGKYVVVGGNNNGHLDPGSWHAKRQDYLDRGYKPLPDEDYKKFSPGRQESDKARYEAAAKKEDSLQSEYERKYSKEYNKYGDPDPESWGDDKSESASKDYAEVLKAAEERDEAYKNYTKNLKYDDPHNNPYSKDAKVNSVLDIKVRDETFTKNRQDFNRSIYDDYKDTYKFGDNTSYEEIFHKMLDDGDDVESAYKATDWIKGYREAYKLNQDNVSYKGSGEDVDKVNRQVSKKVGKESGSQGGSYDNGNYRVTYTNKGLVVRGPNGAIVGTYHNDHEADKAIEEHRLSGSINVSNKVLPKPSNVDNQIKNIDRKIKEIKEYGLAQRLDPYTLSDYNKKLEELEKKRKRLLNNKGKK